MRREEHSEWWACGSIVRSMEKVRMLEVWEDLTGYAPLNERFQASDKEFEGCQLTGFGSTAEKAIADWHTQNDD